MLDITVSDLRIKQEKCYKKIKTLMVKSAVENVTEFIIEYDMFIISELKFCPIVLIDDRIEFDLIINWNLPRTKLQFNK